MIMTYLKKKECLFSRERLEKAIERIKENRKVKDLRLEESILKKQEFEATVEKMALNARTDSGMERAIAKMLYEADIPVTEENIEEIKQATEKPKKQKVYQIHPKDI